MQSLNSETVNLILEEVTQWASGRTDIVAAALVGSWARGAARVDSDIDLMFLAANPASFRDRVSDLWIYDSESLTKFNPSNPSPQI